MPCDRCEDLRVAGVLVWTPAPGTTHSKAGVYELSPLGASVYTISADPVSGYRGPRLCFAQTRVHRVVEAQSALRIGGQIVIGIRFVVQADNPHPFLYEARARALGLPLPSQGRPALFPPERTTVMLSATGAYLRSDPTFRYGSWLHD